MHAGPESLFSTTNPPLPSLFLYRPLCFPRVASLPDISDIVSLVEHFPTFPEASHFPPAWCCNLVFVVSLEGLSSPSLSVRLSLPAVHAHQRRTVSGSPLLLLIVGSYLTLRSMRTGSGSLHRSRFVSTPRSREPSSIPVSPTISPQGLDSLLGDPQQLSLSLSLAHKRR